MSDTNTQSVDVSAKTDLSQEQMDRAIPISRKILSLIASAELPMGELKRETCGVAYDAAIKSSLQLMLDANLQVSDVQMVAALMLQPLDIVGKGIDHAMKINLQQASAKLWKKDPLEVTLSEVDALLKS